MGYAIPFSQYVPFFIMESRVRGARIHTLPIPKYSIRVSGTGMCTLPSGTGMLATQLKGYHENDLLL